jgi:hypothetical protein
LQDRRVETFGEPVVDRREEITGFGALALVAPEASELEGGTQLPEFGTLPPCYCKRIAIAGLRGRMLIDGQE